MLFGGFGCEPGYENCGYDQESYVSYIDAWGAATYQNQKLRRVFKFMLQARSAEPYSQHILKTHSQSNGSMGND